MSDAAALDPRRARRASAAPGRGRRQGQPRPDPDHRRQRATSPARRCSPPTARCAPARASCRSPPPTSSPSPLGIAMPEAMVVGHASHRDGGFAELGDRGARRDGGAGRRDRRRAGARIEQRRRAARRAPARRSGKPLALDAALLHILPDLRSAGARRDRPADPAAPRRRNGQPARLRRGRGRGRSARRRPRAAPSATAPFVLVKGVQSHVVAPDGARLALSPAAAPGSASRAAATSSPGSPAACSRRGADPLTALLWAVWLHGEAGARAVEKGRPARLPRPRNPRRSPGATAALITR